MLLFRFALVIFMVENRLWVSGQDFDIHGTVTDGYEFIYHTLHHLLLTIHDGACYFTYLQTDPHMSVFDTRTFLQKIQARVKVVIEDTENEHGLIEPATIEDMRDVYKDLLADYHCLTKDVYELHIDYLDCNFEDARNPLCAWGQNNDGNFEWHLHKGETQTVLTGPSDDHTLQTSQGTYLYLEANEGHAGQKLELVSPALGAEEGLCIRFWYNMYGTGTGNLTVVAQDAHRPTSMVTLWSLAGNQGQGWKLAEVSLPQSVAWRNQARVLLQATRGGDMYGDIAIDDISSTTGICVPDKFTCTFEADLCEWSQDPTDSLDWVRHRGPTTTSGTGPNSADQAAHRGNAFYIYLNASSGLPNDEAVLQSPVANLKEPMCLTFSYHMSGPGVGELDVILRKLEGRHHYTDTTLLDRELASDASGGWHTARVTVSTPSPDDDVQLLFRATRGASAQGDIAVDTVVGLAGPCEQYLQTPSSALLDG